MATLGISTTPGSGWFNDYNGNSQFWSGGYTMPAGGGVVTDLYVYVGGDNNGTPASTTGQLVIWGSSSILWQSGNITIPAASTGINGSGQGWVHVSVPNVYIPAGTVNLGVWASGGLVWTYESSGSTFTDHSLSGGPGALSGSSTDGSGALGAYITYTPGGAYVNTGTPASPVWTATALYVNTGTPASPVWTVANGVYVNTGTPASPVWTPGG